MEIEEMRKQSVELHNLLGKKGEHNVFKPACFEREIIIKRDWEDISFNFKITWNKLEPIEWLKEAYEEAVKKFANELFRNF